MNANDLAGRPGITEGTLKAVQEGRMQVTENGKGDLVFTNIPQGGDAKQRDKKINDLTESLMVDFPEMSKEEAAQKATKITDGVIRIEASKDGNTISMIDVSVAAGGGDNARTDLVETVPTVEQPKPEITLFEAAEGGTGVTSGVGEFAANTIGQIPGIEFSPELRKSLEKRTTLDLALKDFVQVLSLNKRFPVAVIKMIKQNMNIEPSVFRSTGRMRASLRAADKRFKLEEQKFQQIINNPNLVNKKDVEDSRAGLQAIKAIRSLIGVPEAPSVDEFVSNGYIDQADAGTLQEVRDLIRNDEAFREEFMLRATPEMADKLKQKTK